MKKYEIGEVLTIGDEEEEHEVEVIATLSVDNNDYVAVAFVEDLHEDVEEDIEVFFLKVDEEGDLDAIESDEEFDRVSEAFDEMVEDIEE